MGHPKGAFGPVVSLGQNLQAGITRDDVVKRLGKGFQTPGFEHGQRTCFLPACGNRWSRLAVPAGQGSQRHQKQCQPFHGPGN